MQSATPGAGWTDELTTLHEETAGSNHPIDRLSRDWALRTLRRVETLSPVVLEVGCSSGFLLRLIAKQMPQAHLLGSDYVSGPLFKLAAGWPGLPLAQLDLSRLPIRHNTMDVVILLNVLEHIEADRAAIDELFRIVRPGGMVHIEVPAGPRLYDVYDRVLRHYRRYTLSEAAALVEAAGFEVVEARYLGAVVYPAFAAVKLWNRRYLARDLASQRQVVARNIRSTRASPLLELAFRLENILGRFVRWPVGIRCIVSGRKRL